VKLTPGAFVRTGLLVLLTVVLAISGFSQMRILGGYIDLIPLLVGAAAIYSGSVAGAVIGFCTGLLIDLALGQTLGATSLVLTALGYGVGRYRDLRDPAHGLLPIPVAAASTAGYLVAVAGVSFMLDIGASVSPLVLREAAITLLLNIAVALPFFALVRRVLRPVLAVDPLTSGRRRSAPRESGPLGLRGLEVPHR
jgi:rod shape-determining protein MreD